MTKEEKKWISGVVLFLILGIAFIVWRCTNLGIWNVITIICGLAAAFALKKIITGLFFKPRETKSEEYYHDLQEKNEVRSQLSNKKYPEAYKGFFSNPRNIEVYLNGIGENSNLKHPFIAGQQYEKEHSFEEAINEFKKCLFHPKATRSNRVAANILIGNCYYWLSELKEAEKYYKEALDISKKVKDKNEKLQGIASALNNISLIYRDLGKPNKALKYLKEALGIHRKIGYKKGIANALGAIGLIYRGTGKPNKALKYLKEALRIDKNINYKQGIANALNAIGLIYHDLGKTKEALEYLKEVLRIDKNIDYKQGIAAALNNIGLIYHDLGKAKGALGYFKEALEINKEIGYEEGIGLIYNDLGNPDEALKYFKEALGLSEHQ